MYSVPMFHVFAAYVPYIRCLCNDITIFKVFGHVGEKVAFQTKTKTILRDERVIVTHHITYRFLEGKRGVECEGCDV